MEEVASMAAGDRRKRPGLVLICVLLFSAWEGEPAILQGRTGRIGLQVAALPSLEQMEKDLLLVLNRERTARNLPALTPFPPLAALARRQSSEMARLSILMHTSATGKSYTDRLVDAGVLFAANGENVARSETSVPEAIHESFMASPGHRKNVLNPDFDQVGIGIVRGKEGSYFVTEDFARGLIQRDGKEARNIVLGAMNESRKRKSLPPLALLDTLNETAQSYALRRAAGRELPAAPAFFGEALMRFAIGADLDEISAALTDADLRRYSRAGIGVGFSRNQEYPGGAYFVCAFLVADDPSGGPDDLDRLLMVLRAANDVRARMNLRPLELDQALSRQADVLISRLRNERTASPSVQVSGRAFFFMAQKLDRVDDALRKGLKEAGLRKIGISTLQVRLKDDTSLPFRLKDRTSLQYAIAVILDR
jgi:uncharacterized protein YkwD